MYSIPCNLVKALWSWAEKWVSFLTEEYRQETQQVSICISISTPTPCMFKRQRVILCVWETFICEGIVGASKATSTRVSCAGAITEELPWRPPLLLIREPLQDKTLACLVSQDSRWTHTNHFLVMSFPPLAMWPGDHDQTFKVGRLTKPAVVS